MPQLEVIIGVAGRHGSILFALLSIIAHAASKKTGQVAIIFLAANGTTIGTALLNAKAGTICAMAA
jgi:hypothetical protein